MQDPLFHDTYMYLDRHIIDKQKTLRRECIDNIENTDLEKGVSGVYLHLLKYVDKHRYSSPTCSFYALHINLLKKQISKGHYSEVAVHL